MALPTVGIRPSERLASENRPPRTRSRGRTDVGVSMSTRRAESESRPSDPRTADDGLARGVWPGASRSNDRRASGLSSALRMKSVSTVAPVAPLPKPCGAERRSYPRWEGDSDIILCRRPAGGFTPERAVWMLQASQFRGRMIDVSMGGVAFDAPDAFEEGALVLVRVMHRTQGYEIDRTGRIVRCSRSDDPSAGERWVLVCQFDIPLSFDEVHRVGNHLFNATIV